MKTRGLDLWFGRKPGGNAQKIAIILASVSLFAAGCGGGGSDAGGGGGSVATAPPSSSDGDAGFNLSGTWSGESVTHCVEPTPCVYDNECTIDQNGNQIEGVCTATRKSGTDPKCQLLLTDPFSSTISGNKTTMDFYGHGLAQGVEVTINSSSSISVPRIEFQICVADPFELTKL